MRSALAELTAALLLSGTAPASQHADGVAAGQSGVAGQGAAAAPAQTETAPPKQRPLRDLLINELRDAIARPRETVTPPVAAPPIEPATTLGTPAPPIAATPPAVPAATEPAPPIAAPATPERETSGAPVAPAPREPDPPPPVNSPTAPPPAAPIHAAATPLPVRTTPIVQPVPTAAATPSVIVWPLLVLLAVLAAMAGLRLRRRARISRTQAALTLSPGLDLAAGSSTIRGLYLAGPSVSIWARLADD